MNKNIIYLLGVLFLLITIINIKNYFNVKKEFFNETKNSINVIEKAKNIAILKMKLKNKTYLLDRICKQNDNKFICNNLDKKEFKKFEISLKNVNIKNLKIYKENKINAYLEIE